MNVDYLVLADAAAVADGKLYIHGAGWDNLLSGSFPVTHPSMSAAIRLRIPWTETNLPHTLELDVVNEDGQSILPTPPGPIRGTVSVGRPPRLQHGQDQVLPLVINVNGLKFDQPGIYAVILRLDGLDAARSPFTVSSPSGLASG
jgi:hypothetical protein